MARFIIAGLIVPCPKVPIDTGTGGPPPREGEKVAATLANAAGESTDLKFARITAVFEVAAEDEEEADGNVPAASEDDDDAEDVEEAECTRMLSCWAVMMEQSIHARTFSKSLLPPSSPSESPLPPVCSTDLHDWSYKTRSSRPAMTQRFDREITFQN